MSEANMTRRKLWEMFFLVLFVGVPTTFAVALSDSMSGGGIPTATTHDATRGSLFGAVVALAGVILAVLLAVLTIITSMDERPLIKALKERKDNAYERLIHAMLGPVIVATILAGLAICCIAVSAVKPDGQTQDNGSLILVSITLGLTLTTLAQGAYVALLISRMLTFKGRPTLLTEDDQPPLKAVREAAESEVPPKSAPHAGAHAGSSKLQPA